MGGTDGMWYVFEQCVASESAIHEVDAEEDRC